MKTLQDRFWEKVIKKNNNECWDWFGSKSRGYGNIGYKGKTYKAHRISFLLAGHNLDPMLTIDHLCMNKLCVNPDHLEQVTIRENILRAKGRAFENLIKTHCKQGHKFTKKNTYTVNQKGRMLPGRQCITCRNKYQLLHAKKYRELRKIFSNPL